MAQFTPWSSLLGGVLIGLAAVLLFAANGRLAGISGIVGGALGAAGTELHWRLAFLVGLLLGPLVWIAGAGREPAMAIATNPVLLIVGGLLVGIGTQMGGGCTSGHGICGLARLSPRSLVAVGVFVAVALVTVFVVRHIVGA
jgi:uncharacterized membrane protein YedE/YeeE